MNFSNENDGKTTQEKYIDLCTLPFQHWIERLTPGIFKPNGIREQQ